jgi:hypothetical protein
VRPLLRVDVDDVGVAHQQERALAPVPLETGDDVRAVGLEREDLDRNPFRLQHLREVIGRGLLAARRGHRRIARVEPDQRLEVAHGLVFDGRPVGSLGGKRRGRERDQDESEASHGGMIAPASVSRQRCRARPVRRAPLVPFEYDPRR